MKNNLQNKLFASGLIEEGDASKIQAFKDSHKKQEQKNYVKEYRTNTHRKELIFSSEEFEFLQLKLAEYGNPKLSTLLKEVIFSYFNGKYIFPDKEALNQITNGIREVNNRIAESIQYVHLSHEITPDDIQTLKKQIHDLEIKIEAILTSPPELRSWIQKQVARDDLFIPKILQTVSQLIT